MHLWRCRERTFEIRHQALILGIVNVTPDSFSDGGRFFDARAAIDHALRLAEEGADLLDIGGESTRPGADPVPLDEELRRVLPVVEGLAGRTDRALSIDTSKAEVARRCLEAGAVVINDVTALTGDPAMEETVRRFEAGVILMHMQGTPQTMQADPRYTDVVAEVQAYLKERLRGCLAAGIAADRIALDPGIGFGKTRRHNLDLLRGLAALQDLGRPVCLGVSRKGFLGKIVERPVGESTIASIAVACHALAAGAAQIVRVHDVAATRDAVRILAALREPND